MSVKYKALNGNHTILFSFTRNIVNKSLPDQIKFFNSLDYIKYPDEPLETIVVTQRDDNIESREETKCLTFFSQSQNEWRNFETQIEMIKIKINTLSVWFNYFLSIHSSKFLPDYVPDVKFKRISTNIETNIKYSEQRIKRLGKGYDTDCYDYESESNYNYYRMRSDCVNDCYQDKMRN